MATLATFLVQQAKFIEKEKKYFDTCLEFMREDDFTRLAQRLDPAIQIHCVYELLETNYASWIGLGDMKILQNIIRAVTPKVHILFTL